MPRSHIFWFMAMLRSRRTLATISALLTAGLFGSCGPAMELPAGYAIVYGVSDYNGTQNDLRYPHADAMAVTTLLESHGYTVIERTDGAATRDQLEQDFGAIAAVAEPDSRFFFYFAGHGFGDGMESQYTGLPPEWKEHFAAMDPADEPNGAGNYAEYLLLHYATPITSNVTASLDESVSDDELAALLTRIASKQQIVVIDACHSGGFIGSGSSHDTIPRNFDGHGEGISVADALSTMTLYLEYGTTGFRDIPDHQAIVISAAGEQEFSYETSRYGHGIFTYYFLQAPVAADANYDGYVTATEAYAYAATAIGAVDNEYLSGEGKFMPRVSGGAVDFILFHAR